MKHPRVAIACTIFLVGCIGVDVNVLRQATPAVVNAEEHGVTVDLRYQRGYSTWGPTNVYGTAVIWPSEGVATLSVHLLPRLEGGDRYVWWVVGGKSTAAMLLGTFNTSNAGDSYLNVFLKHTLPKNANAVLVTVAAAADSLRAPSASRALYGDLPALPATALASSTALPGDGTLPAGREGSASTTEGGNAPSYHLPRVLPMTGGAAH